MISSAGPNVRNLADVKFIASRSERRGNSALQASSEFQRKLPLRQSGGVHFRSTWCPGRGSDPSPRLSEIRRRLTDSPSLPLTEPYFGSVLVSCVAPENRSRLQRKQILGHELARSACSRPGYDRAPSASWQLCRRNCFSGRRLPLC